MFKPGRGVPRQAERLVARVGNIDQVKEEWSLVRGMHSRPRSIDLFKG
jgi:hypothetical protein